MAWIIVFSRFLNGLIISACRSFSGFFDSKHKDKRCLSQDIHNIELAIVFIINCRAGTYPTNKSQSENSPYSIPYHAHRPFDQNSKKY